MIVGELKGFGRQFPASPGLHKALEFLRRPGTSALPDGRYEVDGDRVYAMVQRYDTLGDGEPRFEAHRKYIDVQYIAAGEEIIGWAALADLVQSEPYDPMKDVSFGRASRWSPLRLGEGMLAVLWPEDAHAPRLAAGKPGPVVKIVVKVAV
jgi:YhcH/YjgK/YiaL family protein